jgi:hypothetical protein
MGEGWTIRTHRSSTASSVGLICSATSRPGTEVDCSVSTSPEPTVASAASGGRTDEMDLDEDREEDDEDADEVFQDGGNGDGSSED